jgi:hypothetical protein
VLPPERVVTVGEIRCTDGLQTLVDLAATLDDERWEQALESALRKRLFAVDKGQPVYDARRETAVVAATGWLCGRFTWTEVARFPNSTVRRLAALAAQAERRPIAMPVAPAAAEGRATRT